MFGKKLNKIIITVLFQKKIQNLFSFSDLLVMGTGIV